MKTKFLKLICLLILVAAGTNSGVAQDEITVLKSRYSHPQQIQSVSNIDFDKSQYEKVQSQNGVERYVKKSLLERKKSKPYSNRAGVENAVVTFVINVPEDQIFGMSAVNVVDLKVYNQDDFYMYDWGYEIVDGVCVAELPQGTYQLLLQFNLIPDAPVSRGCSAGFIAKENISINQDTTITIDYADAKNVIYQEKKLPNGEPFSDGDYDERTDQYINQPNVQSGWSAMEFIDRDRGLFSVFQLGYSERYIIDEDGESHDTRFRLLVSALSERYTIVMNYPALGFDGDLNNIYAVTSVKSGVNSSENLECSGIYRTISNDIKPSILGENYTSVQGIASEFKRVFDGLIFAVTNFYNTSRIYSSLNMHVCQSGDDLPQYYDYKSYYNASLLEYLDEASGQIKCMLLPWGDVSNDDVAYQVITVGDYNLMPNGFKNYQPSSTFSFKESDVANVFGNSTPVNVFGLNYDIMGTKVHEPICNYVGRMGEIRETDNYALDFSLLYNGEEISTDYQQWMNEGLGGWISGGHPDGAYDVTVVNQNVMIDDMQGCNTTKVYYDTRNEDFTPPTAMMLQFRNAEDNSVTDRFEKVENGVMYLAAKDYVINFDDHWQMGMETRPVDVSVSYCPNGMKTWTELNIAEKPDLFDEYTFGYIYAANLEQVKSSSDNKWYDLKIVLNDEAGNWQEQIISPAFRVDRVFTSIDEVGVGNNAVPVARYTIEGHRIATPQAGVNIIKYSDGSVRKVIVK